MKSKYILLCLRSIYYFANEVYITLPSNIFLKKITYAVSKKQYLYNRKTGYPVSLYYYSLLITKTYKRYGKIYQPLHRFRLQAHIR